MAADRRTGDPPVRWDPDQGAFVAGARPAPPPPPRPAVPAPADHRRRHVVIGPDPAHTAPKPPSAPRTAGRSPGPDRSPAPAPRARRSRGNRSRILKRVLVGGLAVVVAMAVALFGFGWWQFQRIPRVALASVLSPSTPGGVNYLVVGTDSRQGINPDDPNAGAFLGPGAPGGDSVRTDTIMVMRVEPARTRLISIPRDLWVKHPSTGEFGRINAVYQSGPAQLVRAVQSLGIPIQHYVEINFVSFARLVDAVGGIDVTFEHPTRDTNSGLAIDQPGVHHLDGTQGLAYVRSRHFEELIDGRWREDPTADLGRVVRQRTFLKALLAEVAGTRNPLTLVSVSSTLGTGLRIDDTLSYFQALGLGWRLRSFDPEQVSLPTKGRTTSGGAAVLDLTPEAGPVIAEFAS